jgi:hypothetical protein
MADASVLDDRLAMLVLDVLAGDEEDRALLIRYAEAPDALDDAARAHLEARLVSSPELSLQLELLRRMARSGTAPKPSEDGAPVRSEALGRTAHDDG